MSTVTMKIVQIIPAPEGKARHTLVGTAPEGHTIKLGCFTEKLNLFQIGQTYDIDVTDGQYKNVQRAVLVQQQAAPAALRVVPQATPATISPAGRADKDEQIFVMCGIKEYIRAGLLDDNQQAVIRTILMLRGAYRSGFMDSGNTFVAGEAGKIARG